MQRNRPSYEDRRLSIEIERVVLRDPPALGVSREALAQMIEEALKQRIEQQGLPTEFGRDGLALSRVSQAAPLRSRDPRTGTSPDQHTAQTVADGVWLALGRVG